MRPRHLQGLERYEPGLSIEQVQPRSGITRVVKLASNENPSGPSPRALSALAEGLPKLHRYPDGPATALRSALASSLGVDAAQVVVGNGSTDLIDLLARAFLGPENNAVISEQAFARFGQVVQARNGRPKLVPMRGFTHDLQAMAAAVDPETRLVYVANPNNPTGTWNRRREVEALVSALPPAVLLVLDEAYFEYADDPDYPDGVDYVRGGAPVVVLRTFSKVYGLAGLRIGYGVAEPRVIESLDMVREPFNSNSLAQVAALAALADREHVERTLALNCTEKARLIAELSRRGLEPLPSLANFLCMDLGREAAPVFRSLLDRGVIVRPLNAYHLPRALRVSVGTAEENDIFLAALDDSL
ncbi:MAG: histidinol-phosphate transaminase [Thermoplasmata archaeon]|nr:histidinol-phosphate transaminase [Thermoplasmata archaeon]